jgi:hypothetical protein
VCVCVCVHTLLNATLGARYVCARYLNVHCTQRSDSSVALQLTRLNIHPLTGCLPPLGADATALKDLDSLTYNQVA